MTPDEMQVWFRMLGKTRVRRIAAVLELLRHANSDRMSEEDRATCHRALVLLGAQPHPVLPRRYGPRPKSERDDFPSQHVN